MDAPTTDTYLLLAAVGLFLRELRGLRAEVARALGQMLQLACLPPSDRPAALARLQASERRRRGSDELAGLTPRDIVGGEAERLHRQGDLVEHGSQSSDDALGREDERGAAGVSSQLHGGPIGGVIRPVASKAPGDGRSPTPLTARRR